MSPIADDRLVSMLDAEAVCLVQPGLGMWTCLREALRRCHELD
jgi:hypothetical protein